MKITWTPEAENDRLEIFLFIAADNPLAAIHMDERFGETAAGLAEFPHAGRNGISPGTREVLPHESYRLVYEIKEGEVIILTLTHTSRLWPPVRDEKK